MNYLVIILVLTVYSQECVEEKKGLLERFISQFSKRPTKKLSTLKLCFLPLDVKSLKGEYKSKLTKGLLGSAAKVAKIFGGLGHAFLQFDGNGGGAIHFPYYNKRNPNVNGKHGHAFRESNIKDLETIGNGAFEMHRVGEYDSSRTERLDRWKRECMRKLSE